MSRQPPQGAVPTRRLGPTLAALALGLPLAAATLALFHYGPLRHSPAYRYVEYPVQWVEVVFFCCGVGALLAKLLALRYEWAAVATDILPRWDGKPVPVDRAFDLMASIDRQPRAVQGSYLGRRIRAVLAFLCQRKSAAELDDHLRALADADAAAQENSFSLVRFITWAIPILGFLGTVLGITGAISGISPEVLEESMAPMMSGLSEAFDSTALALGLTMALMFLSYLVERQEQALLELVDPVIDRHLAHRFQRDRLDQGPIVAALSAGVEGLVTRQAELWAQALAEPERRTVAVYAELQDRLAAAVARALEATAQAHAQRLAALEQQGTQLTQHLAVLAVAVRDTAQQQQQALVRVAEGIQGQAAVLGKLQEGEHNLIQLQAVLHQNLAALASASSFDQAVHSLTAAIHLLTARTGAPPVRLSQGKAA